MIHIENLVKRYGDLIALDHLNLDIKEGEIFGLLGPNGSGKSTAIGCMLALLKYDKGTIQIFGKNMTPDSYDIKKEIGVVMQNVAVFHQMSVRENVDYFCGLYVTDKSVKSWWTKHWILLDLRNMQKNVPENCPAVFLEDSTLPAVLPTSQSLSSWTNQR